MASLLVFLYLVIGIYYSSCYPLPALAPVIYSKQKEIKPESELRFGYGMSFQYHGQMLHGLNRYNLLVGLEIPDLRIPEYYTQDRKCTILNFVKEIISLKLRSGIRHVTMFGQQFKQLLGRFMT